MRPPPGDGATDASSPEVPDAASDASSLPNPPGHPVLERLELVTDQAFGDGNTYVPNSWGVQKTRFVRTTSDAMFTTYISEGTNGDRVWHLMKRSPGASGTWAELHSGSAGSEPINIVRGPADDIHFFAWPGTNAKLQHLWSTDEGATLKSEDVADGQWYVDQGYAGAAVNAAGDMVVYQGGFDDQNPDAFLWAHYRASTKQWKFVTGSEIDYRYTYPFFFLGAGGDLSVAGMRDVHRAVLGYPTSPSGFDYLLDAIKYFHMGNADDPTMTQTLIAQQSPSSPTAYGDYDLTYLSDAYIDAAGAFHILYDNLYDGPHHAIVVAGKVVKDRKIAISSGTKARLTQDAEGHFYVVAMDAGGNSLNVYPGTATDTDGTDLLPAVALDVSKLPGCDDDDFCHSPTFTVPRNGHALSDVIDGTFGNFTKEVYFRVRLR